MDETLINEILELAEQLPTGLRDPESVTKLNREQVELQEALQLGDKLGAVMEAVDCAYYAVKAEWNSLMTKEQRDSIIFSVATDVDLPVPILLNCVIAKYTFRVQSQAKDDETERRIVAQHVNKFG
jgi:hypothetical protein